VSYWVEIPLVLRPRWSKETWEHVGDCFIRGAIQGKAVQRARRMGVVEYKIA
jgi:hypothetical protein